MATVMETKNQVLTANYLDAAAGLWLCVSPYALGLSGSQPFLWNSIAVGIITIVFSFIGARQVTKAISYDVVNAILGLWCIMAPWTLGFSELELATRSTVFTGVFIFAFGVWGALASSLVEQR